MAEEWSAQPGSSGNEMANEEQARLQWCETNLPTHLPTATPVETRPVYITVHFNNIAIDVSFRWKIGEDTTIQDLYNEINRKLREAFVQRWDHLWQNGMVEAELSANFHSLKRDLFPEMYQRKKDKDALNLNDYNDKLHQNLWKLAEKKWPHEKPSAFRLDVVFPNRVILTNQLEEEKQLRDKQLLEQTRLAEGAS